MRVFDASPRPAIRRRDRAWLARTVASPARPPARSGVAPGRMYKLLALDLDGTLLTSDKQVDRRDIDAIAELQRAGVTVTIVTGRLHSGADAAARACNSAGAIACVEGSHLVVVDTGE